MQGPTLIALIHPRDVSTWDKYQHVRATFVVIGMDARLSPAEEKRWNKYSFLMTQFHDHFKGHFNTLYQLADGTYARHGVTLSAFLEFAIQFKQTLALHHSIEEKKLYPKLAERMPQFSAEADGHVNSHKDIHEGLEKLSSLVTKWKRDPTSYSPVEMRNCLDGLRPVLFQHLDEEVADLRGESLRKYFSSLDELERLLPWL